MAIDTTTVLEVRLTGLDTNGGGWVPGSSGTDWSQQNSPQYSVTDGVTAGTTTITSATAAFGTDVVGNLAYVQGGTGTVTAGWYQIISRTNATTIVVDRSTGLTAGTGVTLHIGGALKSPGQASAIAITGNTVFIKYNASPYVITTASYNVAGGCCQPQTELYIIGYDTTRAAYTPYQNRPTIQLQAGVSSATMFQALNNQYFLQSVILDANTQTSSACLQSSGECFYVKAMNFTTWGLRYNTATLCCILCEVTGGSGASLVYGMTTNVALYCTVHDNTFPGINLQALLVISAAVGCISYNNNQDGFGAVASTGCNYFVNCTAYNNAARGFYLGNASSPIMAINCISEANGTYGYFTNTGLGQLINCADYNNTSGRKNTASLWTADVGPITGSGSFFNSAGTDFGLNDTAGAGASARAVGFPDSATGIANLSSTQTYLDVGAVQHQCVSLLGGAAPDVLGLAAVEW